MLGVLVVPPVWGERGRRRKLVMVGRRGEENKSVFCTGFYWSDSVRGAGCEEV